MSQTRLAIREEGVALTEVAAGSEGSERSEGAEGAEGAERAEGAVGVVLASWEDVEDVAEDAKGAYVMDTAIGGVERFQAGNESPWQLN